METFYERKKKRTEHYEKWVKGWKLRPCESCMGSGYYDHGGSPECGSCDGTGKERYSPDLENQKMIDDILENGMEEWQLRWWDSYCNTSKGKEFLDTEEGISMNEQSKKLKEMDCNE